MNDDSDLQPDGLQRGTRSAVALALIALLVVVAGIVVSALMRHARVQAEDDVELPWTDEESRLGDADLAALFSELLPQAFSAPEHEPARQAVLDGAGDDALRDALEELLTVRHEMPIDQALIREAQVVDEINARLESLDRPWVLRLPIDPRMRASSGFALSYFVVGTLDVPIDGVSTTVRLATRVDGLNVVDAMLGHADDTRRDAFLIVDRAADAAADRLWPLMDPALDAERTGPDAALASHVRDEAWRHAAPGALDALERTAADRAAMVRVRDAIDERAACGARVALATLPLRGFARDDLEDWRRLASPGGGRDCPDITFEELRVLDDASTRLRSTPGLRAGVRSLTALVARSIAVHEAQHVRDFTTPPTCTDCPPGLGEAGESELSAYLASWAWSDAPYTELLLDCDLLRGRDSATRRAVATALDAIDFADCEGTPPADLNSAASQARARFFGEAAPITLPDSFPRAVRSRWF